MLSMNGCTGECVLYCVVECVGVVCRVDVCVSGYVWCVHAWVCECELNSP